MSDTDELTKSAELRELRASFSGVVVPEAPALDEIRARGRARRRHRRYGAAVACVAAATGLAFGFTGVRDSSSAPTAAPSSAPASAPRTIRTAAYTLVSNSDGTATLTINPKELFDETALQSDLERDGIQAKVTVGSFCTSDPAPSGFDQVVSFDPGTAGSAGDPGAPATVTIDPAAMPAGAELSIGEFELPRDLKLSALALVDPAAFSCTSTPPTQDGPNEPQPFGLAFVAVPAPSDAS